VSQNLRGRFGPCMCGMLVNMTCRFYKHRWIDIYISLKYTNISHKYHHSRCISRRSHHSFTSVSCEPRRAGEDMHNRMTGDVYIRSRVLEWLRTGAKEYAMWTDTRYTNHPFATTRFLTQSRVTTPFPPTAKCTVPLALPASSS
jgi:hypothetical protein